MYVYLYIHMYLHTYIYVYIYIYNFLFLFYLFLNSIIQYVRVHVIPCSHQPLTKGDATVTVVMVVPGVTNNFCLQTGLYIYIYIHVSMYMYTYIYIHT